jgi:hypothetical protein
LPQIDWVHQVGSLDEQVDDLSLLAAEVARVHLHIDTRQPVGRTCSELVASPPFFLGVEATWHAAVEIMRAEAAAASR